MSRGTCAWSRRTAGVRGTGPPTAGTWSRREGSRWRRRCCLRVRSAKRSRPAPRRTPRRGSTGGGSTRWAPSSARGGHRRPTSRSARPAATAATAPRSSCPQGRPRPVPGTAQHTATYDVHNRQHHAHGVGAGVVEHVGVEVVARLGQVDTPSLVEAQGRPDPVSLPKAGRSMGRASCGRTPGSADKHVRKPSSLTDRRASATAPSMS